MAVTVYVLTEILVWKGEVAGSRIGSSVGESLNVGGQIVLTAQGRDNNGAPVSCDMSWQVEQPHIAEVTPLERGMAVVRGVNRGSTRLIVQSEGMETALLIFVL